MANPASQPQADFIPWGWTTTHSTPNYNCPSPSSILGTFGLVNVLVFALLITAHRRVINFASFGFFGSDLGANAFIAYLYKHTTGFEQGFAITDLMLFYTTRPRTSWLVLTCVLSVGMRQHNFRDGQLIKGFYENSAKGAILAEIILMLISSFYYGRTVHCAATHGYYLAGHLNGPLAYSSRIMYIGALLCIIMLLTSIIWLVIQLYSDGSWFIDDEPLLMSLVGVGVITISTWLGSWLFWGGYVHLAKGLYCPPKLLESGAIWTTFSIIGVFFGGGF